MSKESSETAGGPTGKRKAAEAFEEEGSRKRARVIAGVEIEKSKKTSPGSSLPLYDLMVGVAGGVVTFSDLNPIQVLSLLNSNYEHTMNFGEKFYEDLLKLDEKISRQFLGKPPTPKENFTKNLWETRSGIKQRIAENYGISYGRNRRGRDHSAAASAASAAAVSASNSFPPSDFTLDEGTYVSAEFPKDLAKDMVVGKLSEVLEKVIKEHALDPALVRTRLDLITLLGEIVKLREKLPFFANLQMDLSNLAGYVLPGGAYEKDLGPSLEKSLVGLDKTQLATVIEAITKPGSYSNFQKLMEKCCETIVDSKERAEIMKISQKMMQLWYLEMARRRATGVINAIGAEMLLYGVERKDKGTETSAAATTEKKHDVAGKDKVDRETIEKVIKFFMQENAMSGSQASGKSESTSDELGKTERYFKSKRIIINLLKTPNSKLPASLHELKRQIALYLQNVRRNPAYADAKVKFEEKLLPLIAESSRSLQARDARKRMEDLEAEGEDFSVQIRRSIAQKINFPESPSADLEAIKALNVPLPVDSFQRFMQGVYRKKSAAAAISGDALSEEGIKGSLPYFDMWLLNNAAAAAHQALLDEELEEMLPDSSAEDNPENIILALLKKNQSSSPPSSTTKASTASAAAASADLSSAVSTDRVPDQATAIRFVTTLRALRDIAKLSPVLKRMKVSVSGLSQNLVKGVFSYESKGSKSKEDKDIQSLAEKDFDEPNVNYGRIVLVDKVLAAKSNSQTTETTFGSLNEQKAKFIQSLWTLLTLETARAPGAGLLALLMLNAVKTNEEGNVKAPLSLAETLVKFNPMAPEGAAVAEAARKAPIEAMKKARLTLIGEMAKFYDAISENFDIAKRRLKALLHRDIPPEEKQKRIEKKILKEEQRLSMEHHFPFPPKSGISKQSSYLTMLTSRLVDPAPTAAADSRDEMSTNSSEEDDSTASLSDSEVEEETKSKKESSTALPTSSSTGVVSASPSTGSDSEAESEVESNTSTPSATPPGSPKSP